jgi:hypothetical protein
VLRDTPAALGVTDIFFERASGAGMSFVLEDLLASPLGRAVRGLHFHVGYESLEDLTDALTEGKPQLERLSLATMGLTATLIGRLMSGSFARGLRELDLRNNPLGIGGVWNVLHYLPTELHTLGLARAGVAADAIEAFAHRPAPGLRRLDLSRNPLTPRCAKLLSRSPHLAGLRSLNLSQCQVGERALYHLPRAKFWRNLVELDLRGNPIPPAGVRHLLDAEVPGDLAALVLDGAQLGGASRGALVKKYGERVVFTIAEVGM